MVLHDVIFNGDDSNLNVKSLILLKKFRSSTELEFYIKTPSTKGILINSHFTNLRAGFEPCVLNLIHKWCALHPKKERRPFNFHEFWIEEVHYKKDPQKRKF
jgi:hypothetical protein